ncbi:MAG: ankyrin repeat domain-containing protein [Paraglaciecola sp.]|nr:ankyrin repeat domain-containing protein [Paraglaciecola sp.]
MKSAVPTLIFSHKLLFFKQLKREFILVRFPSVESILLEVYESLGCGSFQTKTKNKFKSGMSLQKRQEMLGNIFSAIIEKLGVEADVRDILHNFFEFSASNKAVEAHCFTLNASQQQIVWWVAASRIVPFFARKAAFWSLEEPVDKGMPGGRFWYLPNLENEAVTLPVTHVVDWLLDLMGASIHGVSQDLAMNSDPNIDRYETVYRSLNNWKKGTLPSPDTIEKYFSDDSILVFNGTFTPTADLKYQDVYKEALDFVTRKNLDAEKLRHEIPMIEPGRIESVLSGNAEQSEVMRFINLLAIRYAKPPIALIRTRLLFARMVQDGYRRLLKFLCPGVDQYCSDPNKNKLLQLLFSFQAIYNLTIAAKREYSHIGDTATRITHENIWFDNKLPPFEKAMMYLSITNSASSTSPQELAGPLNFIFSQLQSEGGIIDIFSCNERGMLFPSIARLELISLYEKLLEQVSTAIQEVKAGSPWRAFQKVTIFQALTTLVLQKLSNKGYAAAYQRLEEIAVTDDEKLQIIALKLENILIRNEKFSKDSYSLVDGLLNQAKTNAAYEGWQNVNLLRLESRHLVNSNQFDKATEVMRAAFKRCGAGSFGSMKGELARDCLALAVSNQRLIPENHTTYFESIMEWDCLENMPGIFQQPNLEDVAVECATFFWDNLYKPYPQFKKQLPLIQSQLEHVTKLVFAGDNSALLTWFKQHKKLLNKPLPYVKADSILMFWLKGFQRIRKNILSGFTGGKLYERGMVNGILNNIRNGLMVLAEFAPNQINICDFKQQTPLMLAAGHGDAEFVEMLLAHGAEVDRQDFTGKTALHGAIKSMNDTCVKLLLDAECAIDVEALGGRTPLHTAAWRCNVFAVEQILQRDVSLANKKDITGKTPLETVVSLLDYPEQLALLNNKLKSQGDKLVTRTALENARLSFERQISS